MLGRLVALLLGLLVASSALAAEPIAEAFTRLSAATAKGVGYDDYLPLVVAANTELKRYAASSAGKAHPEAIEAFGAVLAKYATALQIWQQKYDRMIMFSDIEVDSPLGKQLAKDYPGITRLATEGGAVKAPGRGLEIDYVLHFLWRDARALTPQAVAKL